VHWKAEALELEPAQKAQRLELAQQAQKQALVQLGLVPLALAQLALAQLALELGAVQRLVAGRWQQCPNLKRHRCRKHPDRRTKCWRSESSQPNSRSSHSQGHRRRTARAAEHK